MRRALLSVVLVLAALILQLSVLDRLPLPGGVAPDLVLLVVVALALSSGPMAGMITGFCAGLALDIAPPADHLTGIYALVFCLLGYFCGLISAELDSRVLLPLAASAAGAAGGAALYAAVGIVIGNPDVTGSAVRHVLPLSVLYDVLLSPFVLFGVALASRLSIKLAGVVTPASDAAAPAARSAGGQQAALGRAFRQAGRAPRVRATAAAGPRDGWLSGGGWLTASAELARSHPATVKLHLGGRRGTASPGRARAAASVTGTAVPRLRFGGRHGGVLGGAVGGVAGALTAMFTGRGSAASGSLPRRGSFSAGRPRKSPVSAATPRRRTFRSGAARRPPASGTPRRRAFSGRNGFSGRNVFGGHGVFGGRNGRTSRSTLGGRSAAGSGPRRLRALRRATFRGGSLGRSAGSLRRSRSGFGRGGGRSRAWPGRKRNGGYR